MTEAALFTPSIKGVLVLTNSTVFDIHSAILTVTSARFVPNISSTVFTTFNATGKLPTSFQAPASKLENIPSAIVLKFCAAPSGILNASFILVIVSMKPLPVSLLSASAIFSHISLKPSIKSCIKGNSRNASTKLRTPSITLAIAVAIMSIAVFMNLFFVIKLSIATSMSPIPAVRSSIFMSNLPKTSDNTRNASFKPPPTIEVIICITANKPSKVRCNF